MIDLITILLLLLYLFILESRQSVSLIYLIIQVYVNSATELALFLHDIYCKRTKRKKERKILSKDSVRAKFLQHKFKIKQREVFFSYF
jgi:hypothetical protein